MDTFLGINDGAMFQELQHWYFTSISSSRDQGMAESSIVPLIRHKSFSDIRMTVAKSLMKSIQDAPESDQVLAIRAADISSSQCIGISTFVRKMDAVGKVCVTTVYNALLWTWLRQVLKKGIEQYKFLRNMNKVRGLRSEFVIVARMFSRII